MLHTVHIVHIVLILNRIILDYLFNFLRGKSNFLILTF
jgi:hypothetical protein